MTRCLLILLVPALCLLANAAFAAPSVETFHSYIKELAQSSGRAEADILDDAIATLVADGHYSESDLFRIARYDWTFDEQRQLAVVTLLKSNVAFREKTGLAAVRDAAVAQGADRAFEALKNNAASEAAKPELKARDTRTKTEFLDAERALIANPRASTDDLLLAMGEIHVALMPERADLLSNVRLNGTFVLTSAEALALYQGIIGHAEADDSVLSEVALSLQPVSGLQLGPVLESIVSRCREIQGAHLKAYGAPLEMSAYFHVVGAFWSPETIISGSAEILEKAIRFGRLDAMNEGGIATALEHLSFRKVISPADVGHLVSVLVEKAETEQQPLGVFVEQVIGRARAPIPGEAALLTRIIQLNSEVTAENPKRERHALENILAAIVNRQARGVPIEDGAALEALAHQTLVARAAR